MTQYLSNFFENVFWEMLYAPNAGISKHSGCIKWLKAKGIIGVQAENGLLGRFQQGCFS
jgi:hypothetical protein